MADFCRAPAAMTFHHAYIGGLLEHTLNAMEVADAVCRFYPGLNRDLVLAGIFLHDIAQLRHCQLHDTNIVFVWNQSPHITNRDRPLFDRGLRLQYAVNDDVYIHTTRP